VCLPQKHELRGNSTTLNIKHQTSLEKVKNLYFLGSKNLYPSHVSVHQKAPLSLTLIRYISIEASSTLSIYAGSRTIKSKKKKKKDSFDVETTFESANKIKRKIT
jgi:hypothetical protein